MMNSHSLYLFAEGRAWHCNSENSDFPGGKYFEAAEKQETLSGLCGLAAFLWELFEGETEAKGQGRLGPL